MDYYNWKPVLCGILFTAVISINGRPAEKNIESLEGTDGVQILEFGPLGTSDMESESANKDDAVVAGAFKKLLYNASHGGLDVPVRVVYDAPEYYLKDLLQTSRTRYDSTNGRADVSQRPARTNSVWRNVGDDNVTSRRERNSKHRNITNAPAVHDGSREDVEQYIFANMDELASADEPVSGDLKSMNRTKNPFAFIVTGPEYQRVNGSTKKKVPIVLQLFAPTKNEYNDTIIERIDNKYLVPILEKLKLIANRHPKPTAAPTVEHQDASPTPAAILPPKPSASEDHPFKKVVPHYHNYYHQNMAPHYWDGSNSYMVEPVPFHNYPPVQYNPYDYYRHWTFPFSGYPPPVYPQDPYHFRDAVDYASPVEFCQHYRMSRNMNENEEDEDENNETEQQTETNFEEGKRRYDDSPTIEYVDHVRSKRNYQSKKEEFRVARPSIFGNKFKKEEPPENKNRASDVGPQISKLIVRRGGVAIAGAGGIATAGSGGTAIVGPGGTAYTTPASSGGVAMVGPGGKVVNFPDFPNVFYGRTASVAATGAGHTTFTNRQGEVFTTNDNTGGVALVNPGGNLVGVSDSEIVENENHLSGATKDAKEVQLPAGALLLTTGPIIYYNPVYPTNHSR